MLQKGMSGQGVKNLQQNLETLGITPCPTDGDFGPLTESAVKTFQGAHSLGADGIVGELTASAIALALAGQQAHPASGPTPWLNWMRSHLGEKEVTGSKPTSFDEAVFKHTNYGPLHGVMVAGCAATACAALEETGYRSSHSAAAESFRHVGAACELKPGAIVGFDWSGKGGPADHVTFCDHVADSKHVACLGGNQSHEVRVSVFSKSAITFIRWPVKA